MMTVTSTREEADSYTDRHHLCRFPVFGQFYSQVKMRQTALYTLSFSLTEFTTGPTTRHTLVLLVDSEVSSNYAIPPG